MIKRERVTSAGGGQKQKHKHKNLWFSFLCTHIPFTQKIQFTQKLIFFVLAIPRNTKLDIFKFFLSLIFKSNHLSPWRRKDKKTFKTHSNRQNGKNTSLRRISIQHRHLIFFLIYFIFICVIIEFIFLFCWVCFFNYILFITN